MLRPNSDSRPKRFWESKLNFNFLKLNSLSTLLFDTIQKTVHCNASSTLNSYRSQPMTQPNRRWQWASSSVPWSTRRPSTSSRSPLRANASSPTRDSPRQLQLHPKVFLSRSKRISLPRSQPLVQADSSPLRSVESNTPPIILLVCWFFFLKIIRFYRKKRMLSW